MEHNKFKNNSGQYYTIGVFEGDTKVYSFRELGDLYVELEDLLEYEFADKYLDGWDHWKKMLHNPQIKVEIEKWRDRLNAKIRSRSLRNLMEEASDPLNRGFVQANRYLIEKGYLKTEDGTRGSRGRPKKAEENYNEFDVTSRIRADALRIQLDKKEIN